MFKSLASRWSGTLILGMSWLVSGQVLPAKADSPMYNPLTVSSGKEVTDQLSDQDIPTGEGGFARDYRVELKEGDQVTIDLTSEDFDPMVILLGSDGSKVAENDDSSDGSTNSLLFARITETGQYIIRATTFGETGEGNFSLKVTRLKPVDN